MFLVYDVLCCAVRPWCGTAWRDTAWPAQVLRRLREETAQVHGAHMQITPEQVRDGLAHAVMCCAGICCAVVAGAEVRPLAWRLWGGERGGGAGRWRLPGGQRRATSGRPVVMLYMYICSQCHSRTLWEWTWDWEWVPGSQRVCLAATWTGGGARTTDTNTQPPSCATFPLSGRAAPCPALPWLRVS